MQLPPDKQALLERILAALTPIPGVQALVLGGSYARGTARPDSDLDIGIYYSERAPFAIEQIRQAAAQLSGDPQQEVTGFYGWGEWVNGGGWLHTPAGKVDFLYRNLEQVARTIAECQQGVTRHDFDQQPSYGFYSVIYLAETQASLALYDPHEHIQRLKREVALYPPLLKQKCAAGSLWMAEFSLLHADSFAASANVYTTVGALTRAASFITQALFAMNETYFSGDKSALREIAGFAVAPPDYADRLAEALSQPGRSAAELCAAVARMRALWAAVVDLTGGTYRPAFKLN